MGRYTLFSEYDDEYDDTSTANATAAGTEEDLASLAAEASPKSNISDYQLQIAPTHHPQHQQEQLELHSNPSEIDTITNDPPIHYHLYYSDGSKRRNVSSFSKHVWILFCLIAILSHICYWYGPSIPPQLETPSDTWDEFWRYEGHSLWQWMARWYTVGQYVWFWCYQGLEHDFVSNYGKKYATSCQPPDSWHISKLSKQIIGQPVAVERLSRELNDWSTTKKDRGPVIVYATGGTSVGKRHLAKVLVNHFVGDNCKQDDILFTIESGSHGEFDSVYEQVLNHVMEHPDGSVILWPKVDDTSNEKLIVPLLNKIQRTRATADVFRNSIIILTSSIGSGSVINKMLRKHGRQELSLVEMESFLLYEVMQAHTSAEKESQDFPRMIVLPMMPLDRDAMRLLLEKNLVQELSSLIDDRIDADIDNMTIEMPALDHLLENGVEWHTWVHKKTTHKMLEFCPLGAKALESLVESIVVNCKMQISDQVGTTTSLIDNRQSPATSTLSIVGDSNRKLELVTCFEEERDCHISCQFAL